MEDESLVSGTSVTMEELDQQFGSKPEEKPPEKTAQQLAAEMFTSPLDGEHIPENIRGKSIATLVQQNNALERALQISESARTTAASRPAPAPAPAPTAQPTVTREKYNELFAEDPFGAVQLMLGQAGDAVEAHISRRLQPLTGANTTAARRYAEAKYPLEFQLFGDQIDKFVENAGPSDTWTDPKAWDDMVAYHRGLETNITKYIEAKTKPNGAVAAAGARAEQAASTGATIKGTPVSDLAVSSNDFNLDATQKEIARGLNMTYEEYHKWNKLSGS